MVKRYLDLRIGLKFEWTLLSERVVYAKLRESERERERERERGLCLVKI